MIEWMLLASGIFNVVCVLILWARSRDYKSEITYHARRDGPRKEGECSTAQTCRR